jgi:hypothetical protein
MKAANLQLIDEQGRLLSYSVSSSQEPTTESSNVMTGYPRRLLKIALVASAAATFASSVAIAGATIRIEFDVVTTEVSPQQEVRRSHLHGGYHLSGRNVLTLGSPQGTREVSLGRGLEVTNRVGIEGRISSHIVGGAIQVAYDYPSTRTLIRISTNGANSCSATVSYMIQPGHRYFESIQLSTGEHLFFSDRRAENVTCAIYPTPD